MFFRQDFRAIRKNSRRRQFLNSLRSNRRNCSPSPSVFASCGPSCSKKSQIQAVSPQPSAYSSHTFLDNIAALCSLCYSVFILFCFSDVKQDFIQRDSKVKSYCRGRMKILSEAYQENTPEALWQACLRWAQEKDMDFRLRCSDAKVKAAQLSLAQLATLPLQPQPEAQAAGLPKRRLAMASGRPARRASSPRRSASFGAARRSASDGAGLPGGVLPA